MDFSSFGSSVARSFDVCLRISVSRLRSCPRYGLFDFRAFLDRLVQNGFTEYSGVRCFGSSLYGAAFVWESSVFGHSRPFRIRWERLRIRGWNVAVDVAVVPCFGGLGPSLLCWSSLDSSSSRLSGLPLFVYHGRGARRFSGCDFPRFVFRSFLFLFLNFLSLGFVGAPLSLGDRE